MLTEVVEWHEGTWGTGVQETVASAGVSDGALAAVRVAFDTVEWANGVDLCPELLYAESVPLDVADGKQQLRPRRRGRTNPAPMLTVAEAASVPYGDATGAEGRGRGAKKRAKSL